MLFNLNKFNKEIQRLRELKDSPDVLSVGDKQRIKQNILQAIKSPAPVKAASLSWREKTIRLARFVVPAVLGASLVGGTALAAQTTKPGDALFPVKIATEKVQLGLTASEQSKAQLKAKFAQERLNELQKLSDDSGLSDNNANGSGDDSDLNLHFSGTTTAGVRIQTGSSTTSAIQSGVYINASNSGLNGKSGKNRNLEIKAKQEAEIEVNNALEALNKVQKKLQDKGDDKAAQAISKNIINLQNNATQSLKVNFNQRGRGRGGQDGSVEGSSTKNTDPGNFFKLRDGNQQKQDGNSSNQQSVNSQNRINVNLKSGVQIGDDKAKDGSGDDN